MTNLQKKRAIRIKRLAIPKRYRRKKTLVLRVGNVEKREPIRVIKKTSKILERIIGFLQRLRR